MFQYLEMGSILNTIVNTYYVVEKEIGWALPISGGGGRSQAVAGQGPRGPNAKEQRPKYQQQHAGGGGLSHESGYPNLRISSQIALFRSPLIPGRQLTAVGLKIPVLRVAYNDLSL